MSGTTIRISQRDKLKLEALAKAIKKNSLGEAFSEIIRFIDRRREEFLMSQKGGGPEPMLELLKSARGYGKTDARRVDEYLYGRD